MKLYFENTDGERTLMDNVIDINDALEYIQTYCNNYCIGGGSIRKWREDEFIVFDFGSHSEFFLLDTRLN